MARDELHVVRDELHINATMLSRVSQEASEVVWSMECLTEECHGFCGDFQRQEALVSQKDGVIAELREEACTLWASEWLSFRRKAAKVFPGLDFNFQVPADGEAEESDSDDEADPVVFLDAPTLFLSLMNLRLRLLQRPTLLPRSLGLHLLTYTVWRFK